MNALKILAGSLVLLAISFGCTSIQVQPVQSSEQMLHVCIQNNPAVEVTDFVEVVQAGFERNAISSEVFFDTKPSRCRYVLTYSARRSWDVTPYLSLAELKIVDGTRLIASADYHLRGKGGYSLMKWQGTKAKMDPVIDKLLGAN